MIAKFSRWTLIVATVWMCEEACFAAQTSRDAGTEPSMRFGTLRVAPTVTLNGGIDTNVFNAADQAKRDFAWTLSPNVATTIRMGPVGVSGKSSTDFVYFQHLTSERSINLDNSVKATVLLNRIQPYFRASFIRTRQRPSFEIDARSLRHDHSFSLGLTARLSGRAKAEFVATQSTIDFDANDVFLGTYLRDVLNRTTTVWSSSLYYQLTPVTTLSVGVDASNDRFRFIPARNSRSTRVAPAIEFGSALISGKASVGYRTFDGRDRSMPAFKGTIAEVNVAYTLLGATRLVLQVSRDLDYSFELATPYYVLSTVSGGVIRQISDSVGVSAHAGSSRLNFRELEAGTVNAGAGRVDRLVFYGGGLIRKVRRNLRVNIDIDYYRRWSPATLRQYSGLRGGSSVVYGF